MRFIESLFDGDVLCFNIRQYISYNPIESVYSMNKKYLNTNIMIQYLYSQIRHAYYQLFFKHPHKQNVSYITHLCISIHLSASFLMASLQAFIHALVPYYFQTTSNDWITYIDNYMEYCYIKK